MTAATVRSYASVIVVALALAACDDLLNVNNPGSLSEGQLADPSLEQFIINGVIGEFQAAYVNYALWSGVLADELFIAHTSPPAIEVSRHSFNDNNANNEDVYARLQRARQAADDAVDRITAMLGARADSTLSVASALIYGGYSYVLLAEGFCEAPVNLSAPLPSEELFARAIARFEQGITVATSARTATNSAAALDLIRLARVGAARASLHTGDLSRARLHGDSVPSPYERWAYYSANSVRENNAIAVAAREQLPWLAMHPGFQLLDDVRAPRAAAARPSQSGIPIVTPLLAAMHSGWDAAVPAPIEITTDIRFASGLEARYVVVETGGPTAAMLTFVNARRAVAGKAPVTLSGSALLTEFRVQRALDFYLTGQRLGDLRRYLRAGTDLFPTGTVPLGSDTYGTVHCFIVPLSEKAGNPNY